MLGAREERRGKKGRRGECESLYLNPHSTLAVSEQEGLEDRGGEGKEEERDEKEVRCQRR